MADLQGVLQGVNGYDLLTRMLTYAVRCPTVSHVAVQRLSPLHFSETTQLEFVYVWLAAQAVMEKYGEPPTPQDLAAMAVSAMSGEGYTDPAFHQQIYRLVSNIYAFQEEPWNEQLGLQLLDAFFNQVFSRNIGMVAAGGKTRDEVMDQLAVAHSSLRVMQQKALDPFDITTELAFPPRQPTGTTFFDLLLGGGILPTECYGILGPSGGGKTTLSVQLACSMADRKQHIEYFTYEQPAADLRPRFLSCAGRISIAEMNGKNWEQMSEPTRQRITETSAANKSYLHVHDRAAEGNSLSDIFDVIRNSIDAGRKPAMVIIDWIWPLVMRIAQTSDRRNIEERKIVQSITNDFKAAAARYGVAFLLLHQLSTSSAKQAPASKPEWFNSAEAGSFAWLLHYCIAIGRMDSAGYCWMVGSKARNAKRQSYLVQLLGEFCRFKEADQSMKYDAKSKLFVRGDDAGRMPGSTLAGSSGATPPDDEYANQKPGIN